MPQLISILPIQKALGSRKIKKDSIRIEENEHFK